MKYYNKILFNNSDMSGNLQSSPFQVEQTYGLAIQLTWTGAVTGTFELQGSNDPGVQQPEGGITGVTNWTTINDSPDTINGAGTLMYNVNGVFYKWIRVVYIAATGGTASLFGILNAKGV